MAGQTLRSLVVSVSAETSAYQREMARAGRMGQSYFRTIATGNRDAAAGWRSQQAAMSAQSSALSSLTGSVSNYVSVMVGALAVGNLVRHADAWNSISARLKLATSNVEEFATVQKGLFAISQTTTTAFSDNANLYTRSSRALKEYGYTTKDAINFTEALATSFALSGSSSQEVASVTTQLSQALAKGVLRGQDFNSVSQSGARAMVALADGLGVSTGALKGMADNGLLTTDKLVTALLSQLEKLRAEYAQMPSTVSGGMQALDNAFQMWVGGADSATGSTTTLYKAIMFVANNMDGMAATVMTAGAAYAGLKLGQISKTLIEQAAAWRTNRSAVIGQTRAQVDATTAAARRAAAEVLAARAEVTATRGTDAHTAALSRLRLARLADQQATVAQTQAQVANNAATSLAGRAGAGLLGVLGGPAGLALAAGTVAASFLLFSDNADKATSAAIDLKKPVEELRKEWEALGNAQRRPILAKLTEEQEQAKKRAAEIVKEMQAVAQGPSGNYMGGQNFQANQYQRTAAAANFRRGIQGGIDIDAATQNLVQNIQPTEELKGKLQGLAAEYQTTIDRVFTTGRQMTTLTSVMDAAKAAAEALGGGLKTIKPPDAATTEAWTKRIEALTEKAAKAKDPSELGEVNRQGVKDKLDLTPEGQALLKQAQAAATAADAEEKAKKAREESARKSKQAAEEATRKAKQLDDDYKRTLNTLQQQSAVFGKNTELAKIKYQTTQGELKALTDVQKKELERVAAAQDVLEAQKAYKTLMADSETAEQKLVTQMRERVRLLKEAQAQGGVTPAQYDAATRQFSKDAITKAPTFSGLDASVGGAAGELVKVAEAQKAQEKWKTDELARQKKFLDEKLINEQQHADAVAEVTKTNNEKMGSLGTAYQTATLSMFADVTSNAADMLDQLGQRGSLAYKALFLASKASAIAQAVISTEVASAKALELGPIMGIPAAALVKGLGYASVGMIAATALTGMAHDGIDNVPREGTWLLDQGERVVDRRTNGDLKAYLSRAGNQANASTVGAAPIVYVTVQSDGTTSTQAPAGLEQFGSELGRFVDTRWRVLMTKELADGGMVKRALNRR